MKRALAVVSIAVLLASLMACAGTPKVPVLRGEQLLDHKGTALGYKPPKWFEVAYIGSYRDVENLPEYKGYTVFIANSEAQNLQAAQLLAGRMDAQTQLAAYLSTRVKDAFKGANVADADSKNFGSYGERFVTSVSEATFTGFRMETEWWVHVQTFNSDNRPDRQLYRILQLWSISDEMLKRQFDILLNKTFGGEPKTAEQQRAIDLVRNTYTGDFFGN